MPPTARPRLGIPAMPDPPESTPPRSFSCPHCQRPFRAPPEAAGGTVACPHCQQAVQLPSQPLPSAATPPAAPLIDTGTPHTAPTTATEAAVTVPVTTAAQQSDVANAATRRSLDREASQRERFVRMLGFWMISVVVLTVTLIVLYLLGPLG